MVVLTPGPATSPYGSGTSCCAEGEQLLQLEPMDACVQLPCRDWPPGCQKSAKVRNTKLERRSTVPK